VPDAVTIELLLPALDFAVGLSLVRRGFDMSQTGQGDQLLKVLGDELEAVR
jgi:hypothetical protein